MAGMSAGTSTNMDFGTDGGGKTKDVSIIKPLVFGNIARYFGKKREEDGHTHEWTVYLKPYHNEDMSTYIKKVQFRLHDSYTNQNRVLTRPPYEVTETGWGEFDIGIKIFFHDPNERAVSLYHTLKLFQSSPGTSSTITTSLPSTSSWGTNNSNPTEGKKILVAEVYEELIFQEPSAMLYQLLTNTPQLTLSEHKHYTDFEAKKLKTLANIAVGREIVTKEIAYLRNKIKLAKETNEKFREKRNEAQAEANQ